MRNYFIIIGLLLWSTGQATAQEDELFNNTKHRVGLISGCGCQNVNQLLTSINESHALVIKDYLNAKGIDPEQVGLNVEYDYQILFFQFQYYWAFLRKKSWGLDLVVQPQYNLTKFKIEDNPNELKGYELGVNAGVMIRKNLFKDRLSIYSIISAGPHYLSGCPERQSKGFIFSDNLFAGLNLKLFKNTYLDFRPGFRHISNASLSRPNGGLNNFVISAGVMHNL
ncbi:Lipid A 3-O-deacylase (PagL) [Spirosomataceae bacterium TFI 002]|nr:Lipid A 3-O-deacylase (PagL) [Spirosomataceae bacterium TFI 002]